MTVITYLCCQPEPGQVLLHLVSEVGGLLCEHKITLPIVWTVRVQCGGIYNKKKKNKKSITKSKMGLE